MQRITRFLLLSLVLTFEAIHGTRQNQYTSTPTDASVAVLGCDQTHPNVYFDVLQKEWMVHGADTKCYQSEPELLDLCRSVYPGLGVVNIMRMSEPVQFTVYACKMDNNVDIFSLAKNNEGCSQVAKRRVTPYKCLYKEYKAENLFIPPTCEFQHLISNDGCQSQDHLNLLATEKCKSGNAKLNTSLLLKWCDGVGTFTGIEFVCCPKTYMDYTPRTVLEDEDIDDDFYNIDSEFYDDYDESELDMPEVANKALIGAEETKINNVIDTKPEFNDIEPNQVKEIKKLDEMKSTMDKLDANEFIENFNRVQAVVDALDVAQEEKSDLEAVEGTAEQKEQYERQKNFIIKSIQNSTENLIKEKQKTTSYLTENKSDKDSIFYEPILRNLDDQYQIRLDRLNKEKERLLLQEETAYEQQVQGRLNEKKLMSVKQLNRAMQEQEQHTIANTDLNVLVKALNDFFIAQENDRLHMVAVYKKLKAYFPEQVYERSQSIINHFDSIDKTIDETTAIFTAKFKLLSKCVLPLLREHLKRYNSVKEDSKIIRDELKNVKVKPSYIVTDLRPSKNSAPLIRLGSSSDKADHSPNNVNLNTKNTQFEYYDDEYDIDSFEDSDDFSSEESDDSYYSDENGDFKDYDDFIDSKVMPNANRDNINIKRVGKASSISTLLFMSAVSLGIFLSLLLAYGLIRRRRNGQSQAMVKHGFLPVDTANPEERHVNTMQTNGYENPTYKYFETASVHA